MYLKCSRIKTQNENEEETKIVQRTLYFHKELYHKIQSLNPKDYLNNI